jgi:RNA polymerase sigma-70 factor (ECF subfamily)
MLPSSPEGLAARGRLRWPGLEIPSHEFARYLGERCPEGQDPSRLAVEDLYLACGCARGEAAAVAALERELLPAVERLLARRERDPALIDEAKQRLRARVLVAPPGGLPRIAEYRGQGSLAAWLRVVAIREHTEALRALRGGAALPGEDELTAPPAALVSPELAADEGRLLPAFRRAFREALEALPPRDRTLLRLHYIDGLPLEAIGNVYRVNKGTVSRWLAAIRSGLQGDVLARLQGASGVSPEETRSLLRALQSRIEVSLQGLREEAGSLP